MKFSRSPARLVFIWVGHSLTTLPLASGEQEKPHCHTLLGNPTLSQRGLLNIQNLEVLRAGPHCANVEVIATLRNGKKICLDPEAPKIKKIVQKILESSGSTA
uniref:Pro-platelet basic protein n=1 Tax=Neovison vison TaxID=452646 RepID=A0A8C7BD24_NEOVI